MTVRKLEQGFTPLVRKILLNCSRLKHARAILREFPNVARFTISAETANQHNYKRIRSAVGMNTQNVRPEIQSLIITQVKQISQTIDASDTSKREP